MHPRTPPWAWLALSALLLYLSLHASTANALDTDCICLPEPISTGNFPDASLKAARDAQCKQQCLTEGAKSGAVPEAANSLVTNQLVANETTPAVGTPAATGTVGASTAAPSATGTTATSTVAGNSTAPTSNGQSQDSSSGSFLGSPVLMGAVFGGLAAIVLVPMMVMSCVRCHRRRSEAKREYNTPFHSTQKRLQPITSTNFVEPDMAATYQIPGSPALGPSGSGFPTRPRPSPGYASPSLGPTRPSPGYASPALGPTYQGPAFSRTNSVMSSNSQYASDGFPPRSPTPYAPPPSAYRPTYGEGYGRPL